MPACQLGRSGPLTHPPCCHRCCPGALLPHGGQPPRRRPCCVRHVTRRAAAAGRPCCVCYVTLPAAAGRPCWIYHVTLPAASRHMPLLAAAGSVLRSPGTSMQPVSWRWSGSCRTWHSAGLRPCKHMSSGWPAGGVKRQGRASLLSASGSCTVRAACDSCSSVLGVPKVLHSCCRALEHLLFPDARKQAVGTARLPPRLCLSSPAIQQGPHCSLFDCARTGRSSGRRRRPHAAGWRSRPPHAAGSASGCCSPSSRRMWRQRKRGEAGGCQGAEIGQAWCSG